MRKFAQYSAGNIKYCTDIATNADFFLAVPISWRNQYSFCGVILSQIQNRSCFYFPTGIFHSFSSVFDLEVGINWINNLWQNSFHVILQNTAGEKKAFLKRLISRCSDFQTPRSCALLEIKVPFYLHFCIDGFNFRNKHSSGQFHSPPMQCIVLIF